MITAIVQFKPPVGITAEQAKARFQETAPGYRSVPGLVRKYYLFLADDTVGGVYLWQSRAAAERFYDEAWHTNIAEKYGDRPTIRYYETPVVVDNASDEIFVETAA